MASYPISLDHQLHRSASGAADDDEFEQKEDVATGISDTLDRYTVEATFKEYLANADDCESATQLNWLLDEREDHPKQHLLTKELRDYQGPALLVHNDGVFLDKDFEGLKHVGRGSKRHNSASIGKFGRGSQTMYHWTDVPMLLSGKYLLILDPLRHVLDVNPRTGFRKPGVKIEISKLKGPFTDQLAPFEGLWGFPKEQDYYNGTIFRFALRRRTANSKLRESTTPLDCTAARSYLDKFLEEEGRIALLFLKRIRYLDFTIRGESKPRWSVKSSGMDGNFSGWTNCTLTKSMGEEFDGTSKNRWWVAIQNLAELPSDLQYRHKRTMKDVECGIAALIPDEKSEKSQIFSAPIVPKFFSTLPLPFASGLPVHVHATFLISGDRASIPIEESMRDAGAEWNKWLLTSAIPRLFLAFLEDLGREVEKDTYFTFWPRNPPPKGSLSELIFSSFWQLLPESSCRLFPVASPTGTTSKTRQPPTLLEIKGATFDLLPLDMSLVLRVMLESLIPTVVRASEEVTEQLLVQKVPVTTVTPKLLRELLREGNASEVLQKAASKSPRILEVLLEVIKPIENQDFVELDGCRCLPLADGSMGMINLIGLSKSSEYDTYYLARQSEIKLFNFASAILTRREPGQRFKQTIIESKKFNIGRLTLSDIGNILKRRVFDSKTPSKEMDKWLVDFWAYWHRIEGPDRIAVKTLMSTIDINHPIFEATCDSLRTYIEPSKLKTLPAVIEPADKQQRELCNKFPGIHTFNQTFLPGYLKAAEATFDLAPSFRRFVKALSILAKKENLFLESYIRKCLAPPDLELLQKLVRKYVSNIQSNQDAELKYLLSLLPVWPSIKPPNHVTAASALATKSSHLLVPWTRDFERFIKPSIWQDAEAIIRALGVHDMHDADLLTARILPTLPDRLSTPQERSRYEAFIMAISQIEDKGSILDDLRRSKLAPDRTGVLHTAKELFDHESDIFTSAFRTTTGEDSKFLLKEVEKLRGFWLEIGLSRSTYSGEFDSKDYMLCLRAMRERLEACKDFTTDPQLILDAEVVLKPITTENVCCGFSVDIWSRIAKEAMFPAVKTCTGQPSYRQETMDLVFATMPLLPLSEVFAYQHIPVCWSQTSFPKFQPTVRSFDSLASQGKPPTAMVWRHLEHLANLVADLDGADFGSFLSDVYSTYRYLQNNLYESRVTFTLQTKKVWLNLDISDPNIVRKEDMQSSWCSIDHLVLSSACDIGKFMSVRDGLMPYEKLLTELGCEPIMYPTLPPAEGLTTESVSSAMKRMRGEGKLLDVTLVAEGSQIRAHKLVLAAPSTYFATQFNGNWSNNDTISLDDITYQILSIIVDFAYADNFDWANMQVSKDDTVDSIADKLDVLLDLLTGADRFGMPALTAQVEEHILQDRRFIRPDNVRDIRTRASQANARRVEQLCCEFDEKNKVKVDMAYEKEVY